MYQQPLTQTLSTKQIYRSLSLPLEEERKLTGRDLLLTAMQVLSIVALCWALHAACL